MSDLAIGSRFGRYRIDSRVSRGGMGVIYRGTDVGLERPVALKVIAEELAGDQTFRERFRRESKVAAALDHPNVVPIYEAGEHEGVLFLAMRFIEGMDMQALIDQRGRLEPQLAATLIEQLAGALDAAHAAGLIHRDVKPANVLIAGEQGREHAYLTDFGIAKQVATKVAITRTGQWVGTLDYVAPEQISGQSVDARIDVYSLACLLFEALTGDVPFPRENEAAKLFAHLHEDPPTPSERVGGLWEALDIVVRRGMSKLPDERFASAGDLGRSAVASLHGSTSNVPERTVAAGEAAPATAPPGASTAPTVLRRPDSDPTVPVSGRGRRVALATLVILALVAGLTVLAVTLASDAAEDPTGPSTPTAPGPPAGSGVSEADARAVVERFAEAYQAEDVDAVLATFTGDPTYTFEPGVRKQGRNALRTEFEAQFANTDDYALSIGDIGVAGDTTVVSASYSQSLVGGLVSAEGMSSFEVVDGEGGALIETLRGRLR